MEPATALEDLAPVQLAMLEAAAAAPSPDNNQPWKFACRGDGFEVYLDHSRSLPSDENQMFDLTAIGAAVENASIAASHFGPQPEVQWCGPSGALPPPDQPVARLQLRSAGEPDPDPLDEAITKRCTCRRPFARQPLPPAMRDTLAASLRMFSDVRVDWITERKPMRKFGKLIATTDSMRFRTQAFHDELFKQLRFRPEEAAASRDGLDVRTLELPPGVATVLKAMRSWTVMQGIHRLRLTPLLTMPSKMAVVHSGAIAVVSVPDTNPETFLQGGRAIERLWLTAGLQGLSMHPLGSLPIFLLQDRPKPQFRKSLDVVRQRTRELLPVLDNRVMQLAFRVGISKPPTERSLRRATQEMLVHT